ncbi:EscU/YscU/HrcU family type III secretion system export apparatus switch protein [uncultured Paludibaculum sp.]|uniref:EscU/YscU/HrcU family type III secretion system export apparatus switch protein n=1 Tax=uncultured Paludibaculum sp. TaxID=1765020 RepID=UPI002AAC08FC|nr:EscU/YscU/HrcU family type III secretion system export apparatus switch protein [uncultured Paludibaculum sp.]
MSDKSQQTEKPTQRRKLKAREEGQFVSSRDFISSVQFVGFLMMTGAYGAVWFRECREALAQYLSGVAQQTITVATVQNLFIFLIARNVKPLLVAGGVMVMGTIGFHLASTGMGFSFKRLAPSASKFNPVKRLKDTYSQSFMSAASALALLVVFIAALYWLIDTRLQSVILLSMTDFEAGLGSVANMSLDLLWKGAYILFLMGTIDFVRQFRRHSQSLKMSKQEIKDEMKETDGNPLVKMRLRRLQRELRRNRMMKDVQTATAVIVNPTHYAVALLYEHGKFAAPRVVAKGRGFIALKIKEIARQHHVPIVENPPLARTIYKSVKISQEIPPALYRAVAEVLAYVHRIRNSMY